MRMNMKKYSSMLKCMPFALAAFFVGCGPQGLETRIHAKIPEKSVRLPTEQNIDAWWSLWDKKTFIVGALERENITAPEAMLQAKQALATALIASVAEVKEPRAAQFRLALDALVGALEVERQALIPETPDPLQNLSSDATEAPKIQAERIQISHYFVSVPSIQRGVEKASQYGLSGLLRFSNVLTQRSGVAGLMQTLGRAHSVEWVEPNLVGFLPPQRRPAADSTGALGIAPEFKYNTSIVSVLKRIRADTAYSFVERTKPKLSSVTVAILDTGVDSEHPELKDQMFINPGESKDGVDNDNNCYVDDIYGVDATLECGVDDGVVPRPGHADLGGPGKQCPRTRADDELSANCGHGSHVAGIVAAKHGGDLSTIGVCPSCKILSIRVAERCIQPETNESGECRRPLTAYDPLTSYEVDGGISDASQVRALAYLYNLRAPDNRNRLLVNVVNLSLGKYFASRSMSYIIRNLQRKNIIVVAAAGNDGTETPSYPAAYDSVVAVCATSEDYSKGAYGRAPFSNFGDWVDVCAPGTDIVSTTPGKTFDGGGLFLDKSGTSQATPFVAGALGYLLSYYGNEKSAPQIVEMLKDGADSESLYNSLSNRVPGTGERLYRACYTDTSNCDNLLGAGFLDLDAALQGKKQSKTNFDYLSNQPSGCMVSSIASSQQLSLAQQFMWFMTSMPALLGMAYILLRLLRIVSRGKSSGRLGQ
jgi:subtilisin family serine protease